MLERAKVSNPRRRMVVGSFPNSTTTKSNINAFTNSLEDNLRPYDYYDHEFTMGIDVNE